MYGIKHDYVTSDKRFQNEKLNIYTYLITMNIVQAIEQLLHYFLDFTQTKFDINIR